MRYITQLSVQAFLLEITGLSLYKVEIEITSYDDVTITCCLYIEAVYEFGLK